MPEINKNPDISIIIPVYNEEKRLPENLKKIIFFFRKRKKNFEVILVDDGSFDDTWKLLSMYKKKYVNISAYRHNSNRGKGDAVKTGMLKAKGKKILMTDCDLSTPIEEFSVLEKFIGKYDIVIGSRRLDGKKIGKLPQRYRTFLGSIYYELLRMFLLKNIKDTNCGFKLFSKKAVKKIFPKTYIRGWGYDAEVLFIAQKNGFTIKEVPVTWSHYSGSKVKIFSAVITTLKEIFLIKMNNAGGKYV